jgi:shikimate kinase
MASGLSSSSATSNAVVMATSYAIKEEFGFKDDINDLDLVNMGIDASLEAGVTITGAFDDATASYFGGLTITDNMKRSIIRHDVLEKQNILIYMPDKKSLTSQSDVNRMKLLSPWVKIAFDEALKGNVFNALTLNGLLYCAALGFDPNIALDALNSGAVASGLSGTGPSFVAVVDEESCHKVEEAWDSYPGNIILTEVDNEGTMVI